MIVVDASNVVIRNMFSPHAQPCRTPNGDVTGAVNALIEVIGAANHDDDHNVMVCFDSGPYLKSADVAEFKADRKSSTTDEEREVRALNVNYFKHLCTLAGFTIWEEKGYEADDLIAMLVEEDQPVTILANDSDLHQLFAVSKHILFKSPGKYIAYADFIKSSPVSAEDLPLYLSITGTHNGLKGVVGYGPKKTAALFKDSTLLDSFFAKHNDVISRQMAAVFLPYSDIYLPPPIRNTEHADADKLEATVFESGVVLSGMLLDFLRQR